MGAIRRSESFGKRDPPECHGGRPTWCGLTLGFLSVGQVPKIGSHDSANTFAGGDVH